MKRALGVPVLMLLAGCQGQPVSKADATAAEAAPVSSSVASAPSPTAQPAAASVACSKGETAIFACTFADKKRVAVCATKPGKAEYRFGAGQPELVLSGGENAYAMYSGGGESQLAFTNGTTRYIVFSRMVRTGFDEDGNKPAFSDGIVVERAGKFAAIRLCETGVTPVDVNAAATYVSGGDRELFTEETIRADPPGE